MAAVLITDANGVLLREHEVPPTDRIQCEPGERVIFIETNIDEVEIETLGELDVSIAVADAAVVIERFYANLEAGEDVQLLFADAFEIGGDPLDAAPDAGTASALQTGIIASLDALVETAAGGPDATPPVGDDGLGNDGQVDIGDLVPDHVHAAGVDGEIPAVAFADAPQEPVEVPELIVAAAAPPAPVTPTEPDPSEDFRDDPDGFVVIPEVNGDEGEGYYDLARLGGGPNGSPVLAAAAEPALLSYEDLFESSLVDVEPILDDGAPGLPAGELGYGSGGPDQLDAGADLLLALPQTEEV